MNSEYSDELKQRLAEIDAGKKLLEAPQANVNLVRSLIVPALQWIGEKIADNIVAVIIGPLIIFLLTWLLT